MLCLASLLMGGAVLAHAQRLPGLGDLKDAAMGSLAEKIIKKKPPITTSLPDAKWGKADMDNFTPREAKRSIIELQRTPNGGFVLQPGYWHGSTQSYCLKAGTHGPGGGDGYLFGPTKGPAEDAVITIVRNSVNHPEIHQHDIQVLLWAIIAHAKFEDLQPSIKATASRLLTPRQLSNLNRGGLDVLTDNQIATTFARQAPLLRQVLEAEARLRSMLTSSGTTFADLERVAVLSTGINVPLGEGSREVPSGRWSLHPDGYYVRYIPSGYSRTELEIWVPQGSPAVGKEFDPATHIAVPGNTARQRLIQSGRFHQQQ